MTHYNANKYVSSAMADLETTFLFYLSFCYVRAVFS